MNTSTEGFQPGDHAQLAVAGPQQLLVAADLSAHPSDLGQVPAVLDQVETNVKQRPRTVLVDAGEGNERDWARVATKGIEGYVAVGRAGHGPHGGHAGPR